MSSSTWSENGYGFEVGKDIWNSEKDNPGYEWTPYMSLENIVKFLSNHKAMLKENELKVLECLSKAQNGEIELKQSIEEYAPEDILEEVCDYKENPLETIECDVSGDNWKVETIITNVISRETDIPIGYFEGTDKDVCCIMYCSCYPWDMSEGEKKLNGKNGKENLKKILNKYRDELVGEQYKAFAEVDYQSVEYWG